MSTSTESGRRQVAPVYVALVHHPVYNRLRQKVATAITNLDVHDIARLGRTFGVRRYYLVTPVAVQRALVDEISAHWVGGEGGERNPRRRDAIRLVASAADLDEVVQDIREREGRAPELVATGANFDDDAVSYGDARKRLRTSETPTLVLFGTGWGLHEEVVDRCDWKLAPVLGVDGYNHLAVRTAAGIILDRLLGRDEELEGAR